MMGARLRSDVEWSFGLRTRLFMPSRTQVPGGGMKDVSRLL